MTNKEREPELTPKQLEALDDLRGIYWPEGALFPRKIEITSAVLSLEIPATSVIPSTPPTIEEQLNVLETAIFLSMGEGATPFNPVRVYHTYLELEELGLVTMIPVQGTKLVDVRITARGASKIGKILVTEEGDIVPW